MPVVTFLTGLGIHEATILDYGAGKGGFGEEVRRLYPDRFDVTDYEPSVKGKDVLQPFVYVAVVCTHVLEHIEPHLLDGTLDEIRNRAYAVIYIEVPHGPAGKNLADGRNAHLIQEPPEWWLDRLTKAFAPWVCMQRLGANPLNTQYIFMPEWLVS